MTKAIAIIVGICLLGLLNVYAFTPPTEEQIKLAANDPAEIAGLIQGASATEAAQVVIQVVGEIEKLDLKQEEKAAKVGALISQMQGALGDQAATAIDIVVKSINPDLLPAVGAGVPLVAPLGLPIAQPLAPPIAPKYEGQ